MENKTNKLGLTDEEMVLIKKICKIFNAQKIIIGGKWVKGVGLVGGERYRVPKT